MNKSLLLLSLILSHPLAAQDLRPESLPGETVQAFGDYWKAFDRYEDDSFVRSKSQHLEAWSKAKQEWNGQDARFTQSQLADLSSAVQRYERQLREHPQASSSPYTRMNLAQALAKIASLKESESSAQPFYKQALAVLADLSQATPNFAELDEVLYLRATLLEGMKQEEAATPVWTQLAKSGKDNIYTVHAHLALGDHAFGKEKAAAALESYSKAEAISRRTKLPDADYERIRIAYRLAWAAYRSADLPRSLKAAHELLQPESDFQRISFQKRMTQDACDLIGDALFEQDRMSGTKDYLSKETIRPYAGTIGLRMLTRLSSRPTHEHAIELAEFLLDRYPSAKELPEIATVLASVYEKSKREPQYLATLERLALILPKTSLWRVQHKNEPERLAQMEAKALNATQLLAGKYYEAGLIQGLASNFETARSYYDSLLRFDPKNKEAEDWELRKAHSFYFANHFQDADKAYEAFKNRGSVSNDKLEIAYYQQTLAREKIWRQSLAKFDERGTTPNGASLENLRRLQENITQFADRFPNRGHVVDLLLLAAAANRDVSDYQTAEKYWNRALLSEPTPVQRTLAIRGLVQSKVKTSTSEQTMLTARNFLKLENFDSLGDGFRSELVGVLASSAKDHASELNKKGKVLEAGELLLAVAKEFPTMPDHDAVYRDGAYYLALAGKWKESQQAAEQYLAAQRRNEKNEDLLYLKARSQEYQLRFDKAAETHLALAESYPKYGKAKSSAERAESLAAAEDDFKLAGKAAMVASRFQTSPASKTDALLRAAEYYAKTEAWDEAAQALASAESTGPNAGYKLKAQLQLAKLSNARGQPEEALAQYRKIAQTAERSKEDLDQSFYRSITAEANFLLGEASQQTFQSIDELSGNPSDTLKTKAGKLEETMVFYNKAMAADDAEWSSRARFQAAQLAETMSLSIRNATMKKGRIDSSWAEQSKRWLNVSQQLHGQNLLARQRDPYRFREVVWVERSALKASGMQPQTESSSLPAALDNSQPYQWSH